MTVSLVLLAVAAGALALGPRLAAATWTRQAPWLAIVTWQALTVSLVATVVLAGVTLLVPITALADGLGTVVQACAVSIASAYGSSESLLVTLLGITLAGVLPAWVAVCALRVLVRSWRARRDLHRSLALVAEPASSGGLLVLDSASPAAFCVPGRAGRIVITQGALEGLSPSELTGVLAHEEAHLRGRHNLAVVLSEVLVRAFPGVPLFRSAAAETRHLLELLADDAATQRVDRVSLASAIVSLAEMRSPAATLAMAQDGAAFRVSRLLAPADPLAPWHYRLRALGAAGFVVVPLVVAGSPAWAAALGDLCSV